MLIATGCCATVEIISHRLAGTIMIFVGRWPTTA